LEEGRLIGNAPVLGSGLMTQTGDSPSPEDRALAETVARHFEGASVSGQEVDLGLAGVRIGCAVRETREVGGTRTASLTFSLAGGPLGESPIFASMSGYGETVAEAIIGGGCNWACAFGQVIKVALGAEPASDEEARFEATVHGQVFEVVLGGLDRSLLQTSEGDSEGEAAELESSAQARARLGARDCWLMPCVLRDDVLPPLPPDRCTVLSLFIGELPDRRTVELKVHGCDWPAGERAFREAPPPPGPALPFLRELAVLTPRGPASELTRDGLERALADATLPVAGERRALADWSGWHAHGGELGPRARERDVERLERRGGPLPRDYRAHLLDVQASGAGPGYGLISPFSPAQEALARGSLDWQDGEVPDTSPRGVLVLAHAGCSVVWLLALSGPHRGEVWVDPVGADQRARRVAEDFTSWYRAWLDALVRDDPLFVQWNGNSCAPPSVLLQYLEFLEREEGLSIEEARGVLPERMQAQSLGVQAGACAYFEPKELVDPCNSCSAIVHGLGLSREVWKPGVPPLQQRSRRGWLRLLQ